MLEHEPQPEAEEGSALAELEPAPEPAPLTVEQLAEEMGWKPKDRFFGPEEKWRPAAEYIKAEREVSRTLKNSVRSLKEEVSRIAAASGEQTKRALDRQAKELNERFNEAVKNQDAQAAAEAAAEMASLRDQAPAPRDYAREFSERNPWYGKNEKATAYAVYFSNKLAGEKVPEAEQLERIEAAVRREFPDLFGEGKPRKEPPAVAAPSVGRAAPRERSVADLPAEAKRAMASSIAALKERFPGIDVAEEEKQYARTYWGMQAA